MISIIVAMDKNYLIGNKNSIPWDIPEDMAIFKEKTTGNVVIMGRKTFESIGRPLPNRINIVISRNKNNISEKNLIWVSSLEEAISKGKEFQKEIFIIGGGKIYKEAISKNICDRLCISHIKGEFSGDTFFPKIDFLNYKIIEKMEYEKFIYTEYLISK